MNILFIILAVFAGLIALILIVALFSKKAYSIERQIIINKPVEEVFDYVRHLKNQDHFSKWVMTDPLMKKTFSGTDGTPGFIYAWDGNVKAGEGEQEIRRIVENQQVEIEIRFKRPFKGLAFAPFTTEVVTPGQTRLKWGMRSEMKYPMNAFLLFENVDKVLGKDIEISLTNLKNILEK